MRFHKGFSADAKVMYEEGSQIANDALSSMRTMASFGAVQSRKSHFFSYIFITFSSALIISGASFGVVSLVLYLAQAFCFYIGYVVIQHGQASFRNVLYFISVNGDSFIHVQFDALCGFSSP